MTYNVHSIAEDNMDSVNLGSSGLQVSRLCLGSMTFGEAPEGSPMHGCGSDAATSHAILERALEAGVNFVDTADVYGGGLSERLIGDWFAKTGRRDEVVLATKFRFAPTEGPNHSGAQRLRILRCVEDSLRRLKTDRIDLYQVHMQDPNTPEEETLRALDDLVRQGKVLYLGASNYAAYRLMESLHVSATQHLERYVALQPQYNLLVRGIEREHVPLCERHGIGIIPWSPLAGGLLTGKYARGNERPAGARFGESDLWWSMYEAESTWKLLEVLVPLAKQLGATPGELALAWLLHKRGVDSVIFGARTLEQLDANLKAAELSLDAETVARLDEASAFDLGHPYDFMQMVLGGW